MILGMASSIVVSEEVGPRLSRRLIPLDHFDLSLISDPRPAQGQAVQAYGLALVRPRSNFPPIQLYLRASRRWYERSYERIATPVRKPGQDPLPADIRRALRPTVLGDYVPLRLEVSSDLAYVAWEQAILAEMSAGGRWTPTRSPQIVRIRPRGFPPPRAKWARAWGRSARRSGGSSSKGAQGDGCVGPRT